MQVEEELARFSPEKDMLLTIGVFDGVHLGHRYLISNLVSRAKQQGLLSGVVTFKQHPRELLSPHARLSYLTTLAEREQLLKHEGVDMVIALSFTRELANLTAREFVSLLQKHLRMRGLVIGPDFALGKNREGNAATLSVLGEEIGFTVTPVQPKKLDGEVASSTAIRNALADGNMQKVTRLFGHPFSLNGRVTTGEHRGAGMGFPTANIDVDARQALPPDGVYATWAYIEGKAYQSMTNIGRRPTFGAHNKRTIEVFILSYDRDLYGKDLKIELVERLRGEKKFENVEALTKQIAEDVKHGREILNDMAKKII
jgi:riboflavin kinase/FMN adenylyltransferase